MAQPLAQPNAAPLSDFLIDRILDSLPERDELGPPAEVHHLDQHSNDVTAVHFAQGRTLMIKRGRHSWSNERFATSRAAARLLRPVPGVRVPQPLELPDELDGAPLEAYWRVDLPTLQQRWPRLSAVERTAALRSWGRLMRRVHSVPRAGFGVPGDVDAPSSLSRHLAADLEQRLLPAVRGEWPQGVAVVEGLLDAVGETAEHVGGRSVLLHNDLHIGNVLCQGEGDQVRCVGLLDLETATSGPPEQDLACAQVHHGPLFCQPLPGRWFQEVRAGYAEDLHPLGLAFFRTYHLANMGFYSALIGHDDHARAVAQAARDELTTVRALRTR